jgi:hypothetical protein
MTWDPYYKAANILADQCLKKVNTAPVGVQSKVRGCHIGEKDFTENGMVPSILGDKIILYELILEVNLRRII